MKRYGNLRAETQLEKAAFCSSTFASAPPVRAWSKASGGSSAPLRKAPKYLPPAPRRRTFLIITTGELPVDLREKVAAHLSECPYCREDIAWLERTAESKVVAMPSRRIALYGAIAAAAALAVGLPLLHNHGRSPYADLAQMPAINEKDLLATLERPAEFGQMFEDSLNAYNAGDFAAAEEKLKPILAAYPANPSVLFVEAMAEYRKGNLPQAADLMGRSESTQPMSAFRCWANLQMSLITGSRAGIDRECRHLAGHPEYKDQVRRISETVTQRGA